MKTRLIIDIESPNAKDTNVVPEEGKSEDDYTDEELIKFREEYSRDLHKSLINQFDVGWIEERCIENMDELGIDGYDSFADYGIKLTITKTEKPTSGCDER